MASRDFFMEKLESFEGRRIYRDEFLKTVKPYMERRTGYENYKHNSCGLKTINTFLDKVYGDTYTKRFVSRKDNARKVDNKINRKRGCAYYVLE